MEKELQINILPIENSDFNFSLYSKNFSSYEKGAYLYFTTINDEIFGVSNTPYEDCKLKEFNSFNNTELTKWYLFNLLIGNCQKHSIPYHEYKKFQKCIDVVLKDDNVGEEIISVTPTYVNSKKIFGFILNYRFIKKDNVIFSREIQKRSLSLDKNGNENKNYYIDKYNIIETFLNKFFTNLFAFFRDYF